ncbi:hypothetical protein M405DRAFT_808660 [Rhizopogon salebrosus TDB-379]|nr:hypothetical protein M405DRAFT_808660 [Rhizopogon salebrosus TDB-379]
MSGLPVEGSVYNIVNVSGKNLGASVATNDGKTVCGEPVTTAGYYQKWMVTYTDKTKLECYITEAESQNSAGVKIVMPGKPVVPIDLQQKWTLKPLGQGVVTIGMPAVGGGFDYVWDLDNSCSCSGKPIVINAPTLAESQEWTFELAG